MKKIGLASDHAGFPLKEHVKEYLTAKGLEFEDFGTYSEESCDYPDFGHALGSAIEAGSVYPGIAVCGSGEGISITLNKHQGVRAGLVWNKDIAQLIRQHNDANVLAMGGRVTGFGPAGEIVRTWVTTEFSQGERHIRRIEKMMALENK